MIEMNIQSMISSDGHSSICFTVSCDQTSHVSLLHCDHPESHLCSNDAAESDSPVRWMRCLRTGEEFTDTELKET